MLDDNQRSHLFEFSSDALFRCHVALKILELECNGDNRSSAIRKLSCQSHLDLSGNKHYVGSRSLYRWVSSFEKKGFLGLKSKKRKDANKPRVLSLKFLQFCKKAKGEDRSISIPELIEMAKEIDIIKKTDNISRVTLWRWLNNMGVETIRKKRKIEDHSQRKIEEELWLRRLSFGKVSLEELQNDLNSKLADNDIAKLLKCIKANTKYRKRALSVLAIKNGISVTTISKFTFMSSRTIYKIFERYSERGNKSITSDCRRKILKHKDRKYIDKVISVLHSPPSSFGINRTSWRQNDIKQVVENSGFKISKLNIRKIINDAGFNYRKAKKSLTSNDPKYKEKLEHITSILSNLGPNEKFFSIDEYGPFAIQIKGGQSLVPPGVTKSVPQWQKSKGSLIITAALELATNQITHFYSTKKDTAEMIKLLNILIKEYSHEEHIYFSWDAASWHASKAFLSKVDEINSEEYKHKTKSPFVKLAPLPTSAQFLNVIESVFSGMARAIIHNSDYQSVKECKKAIDRYFKERNEKFQRNPKRAGNKLWGKERVKSTFCVANCCKDPKYC